MWDVRTKILFYNDNGINKDTQKLLKDNIEIANQTLIELKNQDQQFLNMEGSLSNIEYFSKKSKDIIKRMGGFLKEFGYHRYLQI